MESTLNQLMENTGLWKASHIDSQIDPGTPSGYPTLDARLPGNGWPKEGLTELLLDHQGIGELRLVGPALGNLSRSENRWILWVAPPFIPYAPALSDMGIDLTSILMVRPKDPQDVLWVLEKALASKSCSAVLGWPRGVRNKQLRRLQVASREGNTWGLMFRPSSAIKDSSPAELRIHLKGCTTASTSQHSTLQMSILKRRGGWASGEFKMQMNDDLNLHTPDFANMTLPVTRSIGASGKGAKRGLVRDAGYGGQDGFEPLKITRDVVRDSVKRDIYEKRVNRH